jgi:hypothetical protein
MDEHASDPTRDPGPQRPREGTTTGTAADETPGGSGARIGQQDPASDGEDPSPS